MLGSRIAFAQGTEKGDTKREGEEEGDRDREIETHRER